MHTYPKSDERRIMNAYTLKWYTAPDDLHFGDLLKMLRPDFRPSGVTVDEDADRDMKTFGSAYYDYAYYLSRYTDTKDGTETLSGTTADGVFVQIGIARDEDALETSIVLMSKNPDVELDQVIAE